VFRSFTVTVRKLLCFLQCGLCAVCGLVDSSVGAHMATQHRIAANSELAEVAELSERAIS